MNGIEWWQVVMEFIGVWCVEQDLLYWNRDIIVDLGFLVFFILLIVSFVLKGFEMERKKYRKKGKLLLVVDYNMLVILSLICCYIWWLFCDICQFMMCIICDFEFVIRWKLGVKGVGKESLVDNGSSLF